MDSFPVDINWIRSLVTLALFVLFIALIALVFSKKNKHRYEDAANLVFKDGDERSDKINPTQNKVNKHD